MEGYNQPTSITIPAKPEYVGIVRLVIAAFAGLLGFDDETVEDIKVAVSEACTSAIIQLHKQARPEDRTVKVTAYLKEDALMIDVEYTAKEAVPAEKVPGHIYDRDLGMSVLTSILDRVEVTKTKDHGVILRLTKKIPQ